MGTIIMGLLNKKASGAQCFIMALGLFWDIVTGLPWTPNGVGSLERRGYCIFLPGAHYLTINNQHGADSSLNKLLLLLLLLVVRHCGLGVSAPAWDGGGCEFDSCQCRIYIPCLLSLQLFGSLRGSLGTYGLTQKLCWKKIWRMYSNRNSWKIPLSFCHCQLDLTLLLMVTRW